MWVRILGIIRLDFKMPILIVITGTKMGFGALDTLERLF